MVCRTSFYTEEELKRIGFCSYGKDIQISRFARFYNPESISIGNNVRIDDFCILSGNINLGNFIHISAYVALYGENGIYLDDFSGISTHSIVYSAMDDFSGNYLVGPIHQREFTNVVGGKVCIQKYVQIGASCVVFPNITISEGSIVGACSMVRNDLEPWGIYYGVPATYHKPRSRKLLQYIKSEKNTRLG